MASESSHGAVAADPVGPAGPPHLLLANILQYFAMLLLSPAFLSLYLTVEPSALSKNSLL